MQYAFDVANFGPYADPRVLADLAHRAEDSGWDGFFIWDHILIVGGGPVGDPTVQLAAIAAGDFAHQIRSDDHAAAAPSSVEARARGRSRSTIFPAGASSSASGSAATGSAS